MQTDLVIVFSPVGGGHKAAAIALGEEARRRGLSVEILDTFAHGPKMIGDAYLAAHLTGQSALPTFYGSAYFAANRRDGAFEPIRRGLDHIAFGKLASRVIDLRPRAVIATHHLPLVVLGRARRHAWLQSRLVGVVTDYTSHACWAERGVDAFAVPCARAYRELIEHGVRAADVSLTGIPIKAAFEAIAPLRAPRKGERLRVLLTNGGFGVGPMRAVLESFVGVADVALTVVCGNASGLAARVSDDVARLGLDAHVIGFENDMPSRVAEAHVVVGKAGGLTVSETLAAGRPMVIVGAVPGNEKLNEDFVTGGGAGHAAHPDGVGARVDALRNDLALEAMGVRARALVRSQAAKHVVDMALARAARRRAA